MALEPRKADGYLAVMRHKFTFPVKKSRRNPRTKKLELRTYCRSFLSPMGRRDSGLLQSPFATRQICAFFVTKCLLLARGELSFLLYKYWFVTE